MEMEHEGQRRLSEENGPLTRTILASAPVSAAAVPPATAALDSQVRSTEPGAGKCALDRHFAAIKLAQLKRLLTQEQPCYGLGLREEKDKDARGGSTAARQHVGSARPL